MKAMNVAFSTLLLLMAMACTGNKSVAAEGEAASDDSASAAVQLFDTLVFEQVVYRDSAEYSVKIVDYSSDEDPAPYEIAKVMDRFEGISLKAVAGKPEVVEFINQWLTIDADPLENVEAPVTAAKVAEVYATLKKRNVTDVLSAMKERCAGHVNAVVGTEDPDEMEELAFESANEYESSIDVYWQTENLLTLWDSGYDYNAGAAHGIPWGFGRTFDLKNLRVLTLDDIITKNGRPAVLKMIIASLQDEYAECGMLNEPEDIDFPGCDPSLMAEGVAFDYGPYEIGPYALGMPQALIPYDKIKPYLTPEVKELLGMK